MRILITGGTGFIGRHLIEKLKDHQLMLIVRNKNKANETFNRLKYNIQYIESDLLNIDKYKQEILNFKPDKVIHLAWEGIPNFNVENCIKNLNFSLNLIKLSIEMGCKSFISTGSCWEYGKNIGELNEEAVPIEKNIFTETKLAIYKIGKNIAKENNMSFIWLRLFYVYGPGQRSNSLIPSILDSISKNELPNLQYPDNKNDFVYVEDVVEAIKMAIKKDNLNGVYNVGCGKSISCGEICEIISNLYAKSSKFISKNKESNTCTTNFWASIEKISRDLRWKPKISIEEGIRRTIEANYTPPKNIFPLRK